MLLRFILTMVVLSLTAVQHAATRKLCRDTSRMCENIGRRRPSSKCYRKFIQKQCCATCRALRDDTAPGCEFGDLQAWCGSVGNRYAASSCYENERTCCKTCSLFKSSIPGCEYGDRELWCRNIGKLYSVDQCKGHGNDTCCDTCYKLSVSSTTEPSTASSEVRISEITTQMTSRTIAPSLSTVLSSTSSATNLPLSDHAQETNFTESNGTITVESSQAQTLNISLNSSSSPDALVSPSSSSEAPNSTESSHTLPEHYSNDTGIYFSEKTVDPELNIKNNTYNITNSTGNDASAVSHILSSTAESPLPPVPSHPDKLVYSESDSVQLLPGNNGSKLEVKLNSHTYPEAGTTDDEDLLIDEGSADYDDYYEEGRKFNKHKHKKGHKHNDYFRGRDYDYSYKVKDVDYALYSHPMGSGSSIFLTSWMYCLTSLFAFVIL